MYTPNNSIKVVLTDFENYQNQRVKEKSHERSWELKFQKKKSRFIPYFMNAKLEKSEKVSTRVKTLESKIEGRYWKMTK